MVENWKKVSAEKVSDIIDVDVLDSATLELLKPDMRPEAYIEVLSSAEKWTDAVTVMAHALPKREAVWWACLCASMMDGLSENKEEILARKTAEKWVYKPTEENRENALLQAQKSDKPSAGTLCCMAVSFSGGKPGESKDQPDESKDQSVDHDNSVFTEIVGTVVMIAASENDGLHINQRLKQFLHNAKDIACGGSGKPKTQT
jgi:hypothetical protein